MAKSESNNNNNEMTKHEYDNEIINNKMNNVN